MPIYDAVQLAERLFRRCVVAFVGVAQELLERGFHTTSFRRHDFRVSANLASSRYGGVEASEMMRGRRVAGDAPDKFGRCGEQIGAEERDDGGICFARGWMCDEIAKHERDDRLRWALLVRCTKLRRVHLSEDG